MLVEICHKAVRFRFRLTFFLKLAVCAVVCQTLSYAAK
jgi:hypothetical protein